MFAAVGAAYLKFLQPCAASPGQRKNASNFLMNGSRRSGLLLQGLLCLGSVDPTPSHSTTDPLELGYSYTFSEF